MTDDNVIQFPTKDEPNLDRIAEEEAEIRELTATNDELEQTLGRHGVGVNPISVLMSKVNLLAQHSLSAADLRSFELEFQHYMNQSLTETLEKVNQARLLVPDNLASAVQQQLVQG